MNYVPSTDPEKGTELLAKDISDSLSLGRKVFWLLSGGTNVPISVEVMKRVRSTVSLDLLKNLSISLVDERYGPQGHVDSNWQQLIAAGFDFSGANQLPVLRGLSLENTVDVYKKTIEKALQNGVRSIGQFGIGADGHTAGVLPFTSAVSDTNAACSYKTPAFYRITMTLSSIKNLCAAYTFAFGEGKKQTLKLLRSSATPLTEQPAQILKSIPESSIFSDQWE